MSRHLPEGTDRNTEKGPSVCPVSWPGFESATTPPLLKQSTALCDSSRCVKYTEANKHLSSTTLVYWNVFQPDDVLMWDETRSNSYIPLEYIYMHIIYDVSDVLLQSLNKSIVINKLLFWCEIPSEFHNRIENTVKHKHICLQSVTVLSYVTCLGCGAVAQLRDKPEGRGFDSRWFHWNFSLT